MKRLIAAALAVVVFGGCAAAEPPARGPDGLLTLKGACDQLDVKQLMSGNTVDEGYRVLRLLEESNEEAQEALLPVGYALAEAAKTGPSALVQVLDALKVALEKCEAAGSSARQDFLEDSPE